MKRYISFAAISLALILGAKAAPPSPTAKPVTFYWLPDPSDLGGLSTNDYYTNIVFNVYSVTNCTIPTNQWPVVTNWVASTFPSFNGNWTNSVTIDGSTRFYLLSVSTIGGGAASPFSNLYPWVASTKSGIMQRVGP